MSSSSRSKNFRRRSEILDSTGEDKSTPTSTAAATTTTTSGKHQTLTLAKPKTQKSEGPKLLSFADDDDDEATPSAPRPTTRTPSSSAAASMAAAAAIHKLSSAKDRSAAKSSTFPLPSNVQPQTGEYTRERLRELQKNARPLGGIPKPKPPQELKPYKPEPFIVLKGLVKPSSRETDTALATKTREEEQDSNEGEEDNSDAENRRFADLDVDGKNRDPSIIPDQAMIDAIRAKRERLRKSRGPAADYISLDGGGVLSSRGSGGVGSSDDEEEQDFEGRVALFGGKKEDGRTKKGVFEVVDGSRGPLANAIIVDGGFGVVGDEDEDEDDDEERKWEEEQLRKAGYGKIIDEVATGRGVSSIQPIPPMMHPQPNVYSGVPQQSSSSSLSLGASIGVTQSAEIISMPQQAEVIFRAVHDHIKRIKETHNRCMSSFTRTEENLSDSLAEVTSLENSMEAAESKYIFMQKIRDFISLLCDFLNHKASLIEELEDQMQNLNKGRASAIEERRASDVADEEGEVEAAVNAAISVLSKGTGSAFISAATNAAQTAALAAKESLNLPVQLDEYGRDVNLQKRMDYTRRADARKRRRARAESKRVSSVGKVNNTCKEVEGELSTDESDSESIAYRSSRRELLQTAGQIFSDAADEFSNLSNVKEKFESWKNQYPSSYRDAYMSLSVPDVFSPFVRLELLKWDPLYSKTMFGNMEWHNVLLDYGLQGEDQNLDRDDADDNLVPELIEKVALRILRHEVEHCWDMLSTRRTENAVFATEMVVSYIPSSSKALHELLSVIRGRMMGAINSLNVPNWPSIVTKAVPGAAQFAAYRFGMSVRLLRNICLWKDILPLPVLEKLALEELLYGKLLPHVRSSMSNVHDAITGTERIVTSVAGVWSGSNVTSERSQKLRPLVDFVTELGRKLEKRYTAGVSEEETLGLARRLKTMLVQLNEYDKARAMLRAFHLKEAL